MWLITTFGYFSIVQKNSDKGRDTLTVRARVRKDLELLKSKYVPGLSEIEKSGGADYPYRAKATREEIAGAFWQAIMDMDYSNFKAEVARELGHKREDAYTEVWMALRKLQALDSPSQPLAGPTAASPSPSAVASRASSSPVDSQV